MHHENMVISRTLRHTRRSVTLCVTPTFERRGHELSARETQPGMRDMSEVVKHFRCERMRSPAVHVNAQVVHGAQRDALHSATA